MPTRARRICPRCNRAMPGSARRCPTCAQRTIDAKPNVYQSAEWRGISRDYLRHHPVCALCDKRATVADHYPVSRRELVRAGVPDPDAWEHLRPLCRHHHATETARLQPGGWNAPRD